MNKQTSTVRKPAAKRTTGTRRLLVLTMVGAGLVAGAAGSSDLTKDRVTQSEVAIQQAQQQVGRAESGAIELEHAKTALVAAQNAMKEGDEQAADRNAERARLHAELAVAQTQNAAAQSAAAEVLASSQSLQQEVDHNSQIKR